MSIEDCRSAALAALCIPGKWSKHCVGYNVTFADFAIWHKSETALPYPEFSKSSMWATFNSWLGIKWIALSPAIREAIPRSEVGYFKEFMRDELARITAADILNKVSV